MTVLLVGGTGLLGGAIAEQLAQRDEPVRAMVRSGKQVARLRQLGITLDVGDLCDRRSLARVLDGVRAVVTTAQGDPLKRHKAMARIDGQGNLNLIAAAAQAGVEQFVFVSALKAGEGAAQVPQLAYKHTAELALKSSGMTFTILQPSSFQETFGDAFAPFKRIIERSGAGVTFGAGTGRHSFVAVCDVARAARLALDSPQARNAIIPIGGPDDLSFREAYRQIAAITGRRIVITPIPRLLLHSGGVAATPLLPELNDFLASFAFFDRAGYTCTTPSWLLEALGTRRTFASAVRSMYLV